MMRDRSFRPAALVRGLGALLAGLILWGCADRITGPGNHLPPNVGRVGVFADMSTAGVSTLVIQVSGPGIVKQNGSPDTLAFNIALTNGVASGSIDIPAGSDRKITARAFAGVTETHRGSTIANILEGNNPTIAITLVPLVGNVPITVSIGTTIIVVRPGVASLSVGDTLRMTAEIRDQNGNIVEQAARWATLNPLKASITEAGLVTMLDTGLVQVVATYGTVGGKADITGAIPTSSVLYHLSWNGSVNRNWSEPNNWTPHGIGVARVPTLGDSVVIPAGVSQYPRVDTCAEVFARDLVIEQGASLGSSCGYGVNVYGSTLVRGEITAHVYLRPNAKIAGTFGNVYVRGAGARMSDSVRAAYFEVNIPDGSFVMNGRTLRTVGDFAVYDGTVTMADGDTLIINGNGYWNGDSQVDLITGGVVYARGNQFYGYRYHATGTNRMVFDRTTTGAQTIGGFDYTNSTSNSRLRKLDIRSRDGASICGHLLVTDTLTFTSTGTPATLSTCSSYNVRTLGPVITSVNTDVANYLWQLHDTTGTGQVAGTWRPSYTDFTVDDPTIKPTLGYVHLRFFGRAKLPANMSISGNLLVDEPDAELDLNGRKLTVAGAAEFHNGGSLKMSTASDSLLIGDYGYFPHNFHAVQGPKLTAGVITIGSYLYGLGFDAGGTLKVVMTGTSSNTNKYISGINYESRPNQAFYDLEIAAGATIGLCERVKVTHNLVVRTGATLTDWCGGPYLNVDGDMTTEVGSTVDPYLVALAAPTGTANVAGAFNPEYTDFHAVDAPVKPVLAYQNLRFFQSNKLLGATTATGHLLIQGANVELTINGQVLTVGQYMQLESGGLLNMTNAADAVNVGRYAYFNWNGSTQHHTRLTAGTLSVGEYLYGFGFSASGTHKVVMTGVSTETQKYISGVNFESRPAQGFQNLEIAAGKTYGLCERIAVKGTLTVQTGATLQDWCGGPYLRIAATGDLVSAAGSTIRPYDVQLFNSTGTQNILGAFEPEYTSLYTTVAVGQLKPTLGYRNMQLFATATLTSDMTVNGTFYMNGPAASLTLGGNRLTVTSSFNLDDQATVTMNNAADSLILEGPVNWDTGNQAGKLIAGTTIVRGETFCGSTYQSTVAHTTILDRAGTPVRWQCVSSSTPPALQHVEVRNAGLALECHLNVNGNMTVQSGATIRQNCGDGTLWVSGVLTSAAGSGIVNGPSYPGSHRLYVALYNSAGTQNVAGSFSPHLTYFIAPNAYVRGTAAGGGMDYRHMRIDESVVFQDSTELEGDLEIINNSIVDLGGNTVVVKGSLDLNNSARIRMVSNLDTLVVGAAVATADLFWDGGDNSTDGTSPMLTNGAVKFHGDQFVGTQYKPQAGSAHRFIFVSNGTGQAFLQGSPQFANMEIRGTRPVVNNSGAPMIRDTFRLDAGSIFGMTTNTLTTQGPIISGAGSDISGTVIVVNHPNGTRDVAGRFRPTTTYFNATSPVGLAVRKGLEYNTVVFNGPYQLNDSTTFAGSLSIDGSAAALTLNGRRLRVVGSTDVENGGRLVMNATGDSLITNIFQVQSTAGVQTLDNGVMLVRGNLTFGRGVAMTGSHKLVLNGTSAQTINTPAGDRQLNNVEITGTGSINFGSQSTINGYLDINSPVAVSAGNPVSIAGQLRSIAGSSFLVTNLSLSDPSGTNLVLGTLTVTGTITFATGSQTIRAGAGYSYANMTVSGSASVVGGGLSVPGTLTVSSGASLNVPNASTLNTVNTSGMLNFVSTSTSTGQLTINSGGRAQASNDLSPTAFVDFGRIVISSGGVLDNGDRSSGSGGFRYKLSGSPSGFQNNAGVSGIYSSNPIGQ